MSGVIIAISVILVIIVAIILKLKYSADQHLLCPHCKLEFTADLLLFMDNSMNQCPFCHKWVLVKKIQNGLEVKKPFT